MNSNKNYTDKILFDPSEDILFFPEPKFEVKRFTINKDVYFDIEIAYLEGHPIVMTKTLKLYYHSDKPEDMSYGKPLSDSFMKHGRRTQFAVNIINYLSRLINGFNLFHCYVHDNIKATKEELKDYISHEYEDLQEEKNKLLEIQGGAPLNENKGKFSFLSTLLMKGRNEVNEKLLNDHRDTRCPEVIPDLKHLQFIPIWTYVNTTLAKSKSAVHICHLAFILERLVHNENYPEFNNSAALALLNITNESDETALTIEEINESNYKHAVERKRFYKSAYEEEKSAHAKTHEKLDMVIEQNASLIRKNDELLQANKDQTKTINELHQENKELKEDMDTLKNMHTESMEMVRLGYRDLKYLSNRVEIADEHILETEQDIRSVSRVAQRLAKELSKQNTTNTSTGTIKFKLYFYLSDHIPKNEDKRLDIPYDEIWIGCGCGEKNNVKSNMPEDRDIVYKREINSRDVYQFIVDNSPDFIIETNYRHIRIKISQTGAFFNHVDELMRANSQHTSVIHLERIEAIIKTREEKRLHAEIERKHNEELEQEHDQTLIRKQEVFDELGQETHIYIGHISRKVYGGFNDEVLSVNSEWTIRYDRGGSRRRALTMDEIINGKFTSQHDARTKYED